MWADGWRLFRRKTSLTDAALWPPLTGKEVEKGFLNFDPIGGLRHFRTQSSSAGRGRALCFGVQNAS